MQYLLQDPVDIPRPDDALMSECFRNLLFERKKKTLDVDVHNVLCRPIVDGRRIFFVSHALEVSEIARPRSALARHALEGSEVPMSGFLFFHHKPKLCSPDEHDGHDADDDDVQHSRSH